MNLYFRLRGPVDDNNREEINLPQMQESRYRGNPERILPDVAIDSGRTGCAACLQEKCGEKNASGAGV